MSNEIKTHRPPLNTIAAAAYVGVTDGYLNKLRCLGGGPVFIKRGGLVRYASLLPTWPPREQPLLNETAPDRE